MSTESEKTLPPGKKNARKAFEVGGTGKGTSWRGLMFSIEFKTGDAAAYPYAHVQCISHDKSAKIVIEMMSEEIEIRGRNLGELYIGLVDHHIRIIVENDERFEAAPDKEAFIDQITIKSLVATPAPPLAPSQEE